MKRIKSGYAVLLMFLAVFSAGCSANIPQEAKDFGTEYMDHFMSSQYKDMFQMLAPEAQEDVFKSNFIRRQEKIKKVLGKPLSYEMVTSRVSRDYGGIIYEPVYHIEFENEIGEYGVLILSKDGKLGVINWSFDNWSK